jgi:hypothetical protein
MSTNRTRLCVCQGCRQLGTPLHGRALEVRTRRGSDHDQISVACNLPYRHEPGDCRPRTGDRREQECRPVAVRPGAGSAPGSLGDDRQNFAEPGCSPSLWNDRIRPLHPRTGRQARREHLQGLLKPKGNSPVALHLLIPRQASQETVGRRHREVGFAGRRQRKISLSRYYLTFSEI